MTIDRMIELLRAEKECLLRNVRGECTKDCACCEIAQDDRELQSMYSNAIKMLKEHEELIRLLWDAAEAVAGAGR